MTVQVTHESGQEQAAPDPVTVPKQATSAGVVVVCVVDIVVVIMTASQIRPNSLSPAITVLGKAEQSS